jgi:hypothetical protein
MAFGDAHAVVVASFSEARNFFSSVVRSVFTDLSVLVIPSMLVFSFVFRRLKFDVAVTELP